MTADGVIVCVRLTEFPGESRTVGANVTPRLRSQE